MLISNEHIESILLHENKQLFMALLGIGFVGDNVVTKSDISNEN